jgi:acetyl-CoA carboxylase carboxyltransferase component
VTARSRGPQHWIDALVDRGSFHADKPAATSPRGDEIVSGLARVHGRDVALYAQDPSIGQGFVTSEGAKRIRDLMDRAEVRKIPILALLSSPGVDVHEGLKSGEAYTSVIAANIALSGVVPQIGAVMGVTMGAPAYSCTLMDIVLFNKARSHLVVTGPTVVERMLGQKTTLAELGGSDTHRRITGLAHFVDANQEAQLERLKALVALLPSSHESAPPRVDPSPPTTEMPPMPERPSSPFDMRPFIEAVVDASRFLEVAPDFGRAMVTAFARLDGHAIGIIANQSRDTTGAIDSDAARKATHFLRVCDAYGLPIVTLIDVPGFMPGVREEHRGLLLHGAGLCAAMQTRVPRLSVVVRRCYGAAAFLMLQTRAQGGDLVLALAGARIATMGFDAAKHMVYKDEIEGADAPKLDALRAAYFRDYESPIVARNAGLVDEIVAPSEVRTRLAEHLGRLVSERRRRAERRAIVP